jgi:hypothetical protein
MKLKHHRLPVALKAVAAISCCAQAASSAVLSSPLLRTWKHSSNNNEQGPVEHRKLQKGPSDAFTVVFLSDLENLFRNHSPERCRYVLEYIRDLAQENQFYDAPYADQVIDPQLVIHGGDISKRLGCSSDESVNCRTVDEEWNTVWSTTFETENRIPLLTGTGNHDWQTAAGTGDISTTTWGSNDVERNNVTDYINSKVQEVVARSYQESAQLGVEYQEFKPQGIGPSFYRASFRGVQIVNFNVAPYWESYDENGVYDTNAMFDSLADSLDRAKTTVFFEHYPIHEHPWYIRLKTFNLIRQFPKTVHLSGHIHKPKVFNYYSFQDYVAPYPHTWEGYRPAFYSLLVSPSQGILQVKGTRIAGLRDGTPCDNTTKEGNENSTSCKLCDAGQDEYWEWANEHRCGPTSLAPGEVCSSLWFGTCKTCSKDADGDRTKYTCPWYGLFLFFCTCSTNV